MAMTDVVIEVVDARLPEASSNPMIAELRRFRNRPCLRLLISSPTSPTPRSRAWMESCQPPARREGGWRFGQEPGRGGARSRCASSRRTATMASNRCA